MISEASTIIPLIAQWKVLRARIRVAYAEREAAIIGNGFQVDYAGELIGLWDQIIILEARITSEAPESMEDVAAVLDAAAEILGCRETNPETALARGPVAKLVTMAREALTRIEVPSLV